MAVIWKALFNRNGVIAQHIPFLWGSEHFMGQGRSRIRERDFHGAIESYTTAIKICEEQPLCGETGSIGQYEARAEAKTYLKDYKGALEDYNIAINVYQKRNSYFKFQEELSGLLNGRGKCQYNLGNFKEAIEDLTQAIKQGEITPYAKRIESEDYYWRALAQRELKQLDKAIEDLDKAIALKKDPESHFLKCIVQFEKNDFEGSIKDVKEAIKLKEEDYNFHFLLGCAQYRLKQNDEALKSFDDALRLKHDNPHSYYQRGCIHYALGQFEKAEKDFDESIRLSKGNPNSYFWRACIHIHFNRYAEAIKDFWEAMYLKRNPLYNYSNFSSCLAYRLDKDESAAREFGNVLRLRSDKLNGYFLRGCAQYQLARYKEAANHFHESVQFKQDDPDSHYWLGRAQFKLKEYDAALKSFNEAIRLNKEKPEYYSQRALNYCWLIRDGDVEALHLERRRAAIKDCHEAIQLNKDEPQYYRIRAFAYSQMSGAQKDAEDREKARSLEAYYKPFEELYDAIANNQKEVTIKSLKELRKSYPETVLKTLNPVTGVMEPAIFTLARFGRSSWLQPCKEFMEFMTLGDHGEHALHIAAESGEFEFFNALVVGSGVVQGKERGGYIWPEDKLGKTPLHKAAEYGRIEFIQKLVKTYNAEAELKATTKEGDTLVHLMVRKHQLSSVKKLLKDYRQLSCSVQNKVLYDPVMLAVETRDTRILEAVLNHYDVDLNNRDSDGRTALHLATRTGSLPLVKLLINKGASVDAKDKAGRAPFDNVTPELRVYFSHYQNEQKPRQHFSEEEHVWKNLVFQGGSVKGLVYPAALRTAVDKGILNLAKVERVCGSSAGAIMALLIGLNYSVDELDHLVGVKPIDGSSLPQIKFGELLDGELGQKILAMKNKDLGGFLGEEHATVLRKLQNIEGVLTALLGAVDGIMLQSVGAFWAGIGNIIKMHQALNKDFGLCTGEKLEKLIEDLINGQLAKKQGCEIKKNATFEDLERFGFKDMCFVGINAETGELEYFSSKKTPKMLVARAVRISTSIPGIFKPCPARIKDKDGKIHEKGLYVDAGISINFPLSSCDFKSYSQPEEAGGTDFRQVNFETLGFRLVSNEIPPLKKPKETSIETWSEYIKSLISRLAHSVISKEARDHAESLVKAILNNEAREDEGNEFRIIRIDTGDLGTMDFDKVEVKSIKEALVEQSKKGVLDFIERRKKYDLPHKFRLPDPLCNAMALHFKGGSYQMDGGKIDCSRMQIRQNCPALVAAFYRYTDKRVYDFLHNTLSISLKTRDGEGNTAFHIVAKEGDLTAMRNLLSVDPAGSSVVNNDKDTPLKLAEEKRNQEMIALLRSAYNQASDSKQWAEHTQGVDVMSASASNASRFADSKQNAERSVVVAQPVATAVPAFMSSVENSKRSLGNTSTGSAAALAPTLEASDVRKRAEGMAVAVRPAAAAVSMLPMFVSQRSTVVTHSAASTGSNPMERAGLRIAQNN